MCALRIEVVYCFTNVQYLVNRGCHATPGLFFFGVYLQSKTINFCLQAFDAYPATEALQGDVDIQTDEKMGLWREAVYCIAPYDANDSSGSDEDDLPFIVIILMLLSVS